MKKDFSEKIKSIEAIDEPHSISKSIALHLLPGILIGAFYFSIVTLVRDLGFPSIMALALAGLFVLVPFELGFLLYQKHLKKEKLFNGIIKNCKSIPVNQYFVWIPIVLILSALIFLCFGFTIDIAKGFFDWIPSGMFLDMGLSKEYSKASLIVTYSLFLVLLVFVLPIVEELYFRGYLLPRMPVRFNSWNQFIHSLLFALYHTWSPWMIIVRTFGALPLIYVVK